MFFEIVQIRITFDFKKKPMELHFQTKEESNKKQLDTFLQLSGAERVASFLRLSEKLYHLYPKNKKTTKTANFEIVIKAK